MTTKYRNIKCNGFDSKKEARRYEQLVEMQKQGLITDLQKQVKFVLIPSQYIDGKCVERECAYKADFVYRENDVLVVEDVKSKITRENPVYKIKRKLMLERYGYRIREV